MRLSYLAGGQVLYIVSVYRINDNALLIVLRLEKKSLTFRKACSFMKLDSLKRKLQTDKGLNFNRKL
jgi:hypothetical protein